VKTHSITPAADVAGTTLTDSREVSYVEVMSFMAFPIQQCTSYGFTMRFYGSRSFADGARCYLGEMHLRDQHSRSVDLTEESLDDF
jgi:hypothetical protein